VTITDADAGAVIYYTSDGSTPALTSTKYTAPIPVSSTTTLKAVAAAPNNTLSAVATAAYTITPPGAPSSLSPGSATAAGGGFTLTVNGANFTPTSVVLWNGALRTTTFVSSTQLTASTLASDIAAEGTNLVTVANLLPDLWTSSALPFVVMNAAPAAQIDASSIALTADGSGNHLLTLTGTDFVAASILRWNGASLTTSYVSPWQLSALITAADYTTRPAALTVSNPSVTSPVFELR
jgi:hypothetical protein